MGILIRILMGILGKTEEENMQSWEFIFLLEKITFINEALQQIVVSSWQGKGKKWMKPLKMGHIWGENKWGSVFPKATALRMLRDSLPRLQCTTSTAFKITNHFYCL